MQEFFKWTAWEMERPQSYGAFHLIFALTGIAVCIVLAYLLRKTSDKANRALLLGVGIFLIIAELYKQFFYYFVVHDCYYPAWIVPFQLCSVPMYLCVFCGLCKNEKINAWFYDFMFAFNLLGGAISFTEPSGLNHPYLMLTLHAYIWHLSLVFLGFYLYFSKRACNDWKGYFKGLAIFFACAGIAQILNVTLIKYDTVNMFFISPYVRSSIVVFKDFWENLGWFANMCLFLLALVIGGAVVYYVGYAFRLWKKKKTR